MRQEASAFVVETLFPSSEYLNITKAIEERKSLVVFDDYCTIIDQFRSRLDVKLIVDPDNLIHRS